MNTGRREPSHVRTTTVFYEQRTLRHPHVATVYHPQLPPADRAAVRWLCCQTGFLGQPIDPVFSDRGLFADFLTNYYLEKEPESAFVMEIGGEVRGYLLGCRRPLRNQVHNFVQNFRLAARLLWRYPRYNSASRRFIHWMLSNAWREVPAAPGGRPISTSIWCPMRAACSTRDC